MALIKILIGGDLVPTKSNSDIFNAGDITALIGHDLRDILIECDFRIYNLEVPFTDKESPISKCGPNLIAPTSNIKGIKALNPSLINLANNHILDQGVQGLKSTEDVLSRNGIPYIGAGNNLAEACKPYIIERDGLRIGIYACAEHEFSIATETTPGANPFDPLESLDHITALKADCDYVIVIYHGGKEHYRYPSPYLRKVCRKMAQKGADLVVCQHSHCIGCYEENDGAKIIYGQGNFIFDFADNELWQTSLLLKVFIGDGLKAEFIPIKKTGNTIVMASGKDAEDIISSFHQRSEEIKQAGFVEKQYQHFAQENRASYLRRLIGFGRLASGIDRRLLNGLLLKIKCSKRQLITMRNYIECEAHRELILEGLKRE